MPDQITCVNCEYYLPKTNFHQEKENTFTDRLWGRFPLYTAAAYFNFVKGGRVQQLIHNLKYNNRPEVGYNIGLRYGAILKNANLYKDNELIIPVPLHPKRERQRGYNQSEAFAKGLSIGMGIPYSKDAIIRKEETSSQTKKSRLERLKNVSAAIKVKKPDLLKGKKILIVDDLLTTGATLEACALQVLKVPEVRISLITIGIAER